MDAHSTTTTDTDSSPVTDPFAASVDDVLAGLDSTPSGLSSDEASRRAARWGANRLPEPARPSLIRRIAKHFDDVLIYILLAAAVLKAIMGEWTDFWVIVAVAVITAAIGFLQEGRAQNALDGLSKMLSLDAHVLRDEQWQVTPAQDLVPGDIVRLRSGDKVPADLRLIEAVNLRIEESALTGESVPSAKWVEVVDADAGVGDRHNMAFSGTIVAAGQGVGVVTATGAQAEIGRIQTMLATVEQFDTPLTIQLRQFGKALSVVILGMAAVMIVIGRVIHDFKGDELLSAAIGFAVAAIPEGLPALVTITLALGVQQMARRHAIMRNLPSVETLGAVTTVCSDKTGTLTQNEMTVRFVVTQRGRYDVEGLGYRPEGRILFDGQEADLDSHPDLNALITVMAVANDSDVTSEGDVWRVVGEPTEGALATLGHKVGFYAGSYPRLAVVPFESEHKYMATLNETPAGRRIVLVKGAPDRVLERCAAEQAEDGRRQDLDLPFWTDVVERMSAQGLRVLAAALRPVSAQTETLDHDDLTDLVFLGMVGIVDPPRPDAIDAIATCRRAGIKVTMITGDHAGTATAIAREMGITDADGPAAISGAELESASNEQLRTIVDRTTTFARTSPEHKLRLVRALQANGEVVAMTGDGVNDAPALRRADVGVAMGIKGTEATKEAADVVLTDDNFSSIERAIEEGRRIYDNLAKSVVFLLPTNGAQSLVILVAVLFGLALPLAPVQILWVNMVTAVTLSLALAYEPAEPDLMTRPPRDPHAPILSGAGLVRVAVVSVLIAGATVAVFYLAQAWGWSTAQSQTTAVTMLALGQAAYLLNARSLRESSLRRDILTGNRMVWISILVMVVLQVAFVYLPFMNAGFHTAPLGLLGWVIPLALAAALFVVIEAAKAVLRSLDHADSGTPVTAGDGPEATPGSAPTTEETPAESSAPGQRRSTTDEG